MTAQPGASAQGQWMMRPQGIPGCPPGLEYLMQIDQLLVKQQVELLEGRSYSENSIITKAANIQNFMTQTILCS